jgi:hypothetical protein
MHSRKQNKQNQSNVTYYLFLYISFFLKHHLFLSNWISNSNTYTMYKQT